MPTTTTTTRIQISTSYSSRNGAGKITARVCTGPHTGRRITVGYDHAARDAHIIGAKALAAKLGITGEISYAGTLNHGGSVYNVEI